MQTTRKDYNKDIHILVTEKQYRILQRLAEAHGLPLSSYIRFAIFKNHNLISNEQ